MTYNLTLYKNVETTDNNKNFTGKAIINGEVKHQFPFIGEHYTKRFDSVQQVFTYISTSWYNETSILKPFSEVPSEHPDYGKLIRAMQYNDTMRYNLSPKQKKVVSYLSKLKGIDEYSLHPELGGFTTCNGNLLILDGDHIELSRLGFEGNIYPKLSDIHQELLNFMPVEYQNAPSILLHSTSFGIGNCDGYASIRLIFPIESISYIQARAIAKRLNTELFDKFEVPVFDTNIYGLNKHIQLGVKYVNVENVYSKKDSWYSIKNIKCEPLKVVKATADYGNSIDGRLCTIATGTNGAGDVIKNSFYKNYSGNGGFTRLLNKAKSVTKELNVFIFYAAGFAKAERYTKIRLKKLIAAIEQCPRAQDSEWNNGKVAATFNDCYDRVVYFSKINKELEKQYKTDNYEKHKDKHSTAKIFAKRYPNRVKQLSAFRVTKEDTDEIFNLQSEEKQVLVNDSPMGSGKSTTNIGYLLEAQELGSYNISIASRILLINEQNHDYCKKKVRSATQDNFDARKHSTVCCTINSSSKYMFDNSFGGKIQKTLLVIDEIDEALMQLYGTASSDSKFLHNYKELVRAVKQADKVIVSQHMLSEMTMKLLEHAGVIDSTQLLYNQFKPKKGVPCYITESDNESEMLVKVIELISNLIKNGEKVTLCNNYNTPNETIEQMLKASIKGVKILRVDRDNKHQIKGDSLTQKIIDYDIFIYSPVLTTGVSLKVKQYTTSIMLHNHGNFGGSITSSLQSLHRNRVAKKVYIFTAGQETKDTSTYTDLARFLSSEVSYLTTASDEITDLEYIHNETQESSILNRQAMEMLKTIRKINEYQRINSFNILMDTIKSLGYSIKEKLDFSVTKERKAEVMQIGKEIRKKNKEQQIQNLMENFKAYLEFQGNPDELDDNNPQKTAFKTMLYLEQAFGIDLSEMDDNLRDELFIEHVNNTRLFITIKELQLGIRDNAEYEKRKNKILRDYNQYGELSGGEELRKREFLNYIMKLVGVHHIDNEVHLSKGLFQITHCVEQINRHFNLYDAETRQTYWDITHICENSHLSAPLDNKKLSPLLKKYGFTLKTTTERHDGKKVTYNKVVEISELYKMLVQSVIEKYNDADKEKQTETEINLDDMVDIF